MRGFNQEERCATLTGDPSRAQVFATPAEAEEWLDAHSPFNPPVSGLGLVRGDWAVLGA